MVQFISSLGKGQAFAPDFMASVAVMGVMLTAFFVSWNTIIDSQLAAGEDREMYAEGQRTVKTLINSPGTPTDWNNQTVESVGLAERPHVLNESKVEEFKSLSYSEQRSLLNARGFKFEIIESGELLHETGGEINGENVDIFPRNVMLNGSKGFRRVEVKYTLWR